jgi:endonuclease YncB( thermonuclease family)
MAATHSQLDLPTLPASTQASEIVKQGYGFAFTRYPFKYLDEFRRYEREARAAGRGLWHAGN